MYRSAERRSGEIAMIRPAFALALSVAGVVSVSSTAQAGPIGFDQVVIYRVGDGTSPLANTGNAVFADVFDANTGSLLQSIPFPTSASGSQLALVSAGSSSAEGNISRSADGRFIVATGYNSTIPAGASLTSSSSAVGSVVRTVGFLQVATGGIDTSNFVSDLGTNPARSAVSADGNQFWLTGAGLGIRYAPVGVTTGLTTQITATPSNARSMKIFAGQLYTITGQGTAFRVATVGSGLPTTAGQVTSNIPGGPTSGSQHTAEFFDLSPAVPGLDTMYTVDDSSGSAGAIYKYSLVAGNWVQNGVAAAQNNTWRGLSGYSFGSTATLFATNGINLQKLVDTAGYNQPMSTLTPTLLATAGANQAFRGVVYIPEPATLAGVAALGLVALRRRK
jgi:hypothetical protein